MHKNSILKFINTRKIYKYFSKNNFIFWGGFKKKILATTVKHHEIAKFEWSIDDNDCSGCGSLAEWTRERRKVLRLREDRLCDGEDRG